jgi:hypothetical protein
MTATAEVLALPGVRLVPVQRLSCEKRAELLEKLARQAQWLEPEWVTILRDALAHDSLTRTELERAWAAVLEAVTIADAVAINIVDWDWKCGSCGHSFAAACLCLCCPSAVEHARDVAAEALTVLAGGIR